MFLLLLKFKKVFKTKESLHDSPGQAHGKIAIQLRCSMRNRQ
ncbi:hypothetical protein Lalb_Chr14g0373511 [Lupinus albus]|uniref:Uncharacterized protein n=1 Tax=Lupinus albus TaxID=3870 RepID=A0A6A4PG83_LUPAL|nr:hypothetical protein Lalb_Chr14g0373511 [Lupinus albus]